MPKFIPLPRGLNHLRIEYDGSWRVWLSANKEFTLGTFLELDIDGQCTRVTWLADGTEHRFEVTE